MSRQTIIAEHLNTRLFAITPLEWAILGIPADETARTLYVTADISAAVMGPFPETDDGDRQSEFRAWLDSFVEGSEITVSEDPDNKPGETMLCRVHEVEDEFWSIRVTEPENTPGIRSIGAFCDFDEFVALKWDLREVIASQFTEEVAEAQEIWTDLFGTEPPHSGANVDEYLSNACPV